MRSTIQDYRGAVVIYYSKDGKVLRENTGLKFKSEDYNYKKIGDKTKKKVKNSAIAAIAEVEGVANLKEKIDSIISSYYNKHGQFPSVAFIKNCLNNPFEQTIKSSLFLDHFEVFYREKSKEFAGADRSITSLKDYKSFENSIRDYQLEYGIELHLDDITFDFFKKYKSFLFDKRVSTAKKSFKTKGSLNPNTVRKRFDVLRTFLYKLEKLKLVVFDDDMKTYRIDKAEVIKDYLTVDEIKELKQFPINEPTSLKIRDIFIFSCLTGLRWGDLTTVNKAHIKREKDIIFFTKKLEKTENTVRIPLTKTCCEILEKYNYSFNFISNQKFNHGLKNLLQKTKMFDEDSDKIVNGKRLKRWEILSVHSGRHSFISNLVKNSVPLNEIMSYTGHVKLETVMKYVTKNIPLTNEFVNKLDI